MAVVTKPSDRERAFYWLRRYRALRREWRVKRELMEDVTGWNVLEHVVEHSLPRLRGAVVAVAQGTAPVTIRSDLPEGLQQRAANVVVENLIDALAKCAVYAVGNGRWAVNEHVRNERLEATIERAKAMIRLLGPEEMTPTAIRLLTEALDPAPSGG